MAEEAIESTITITNQVPGYYKCGHCALHFKTRARFRAHEATCLSLKQIRARATFASSATDSTTTADLFALVQQLAVRLETAEHEISVLKQQQQRQQRQQQQRQQQQQQQQQQPNKIHRDNLLEWLNGDAIMALKELNPFSGWLPVIPPITRDHLKLVFQHGFMDGMCAIIASIIASSDCAPLSSYPLCAYDEAPGTLFVYEHQPQQQNECCSTGAPDKAMTPTKCAWRPITHAEFERFINRMQKLLMNEFVCWQQEHKERWHDPDFAEQYDANLMKVMGSGKANGGGCSNRDMLITRMKPKVYTAIKRGAQMH
jgi:TolA-binding protein